MKLKTIKDAAEIILDGVKVDLTHVNGAITAITITNPAGRFLVIQKGDVYGDTLRVMIPEPPKAEERFVVVGRYLGMVDVEEEFETDLEATQRISEYERKTGSYGESGLKVERRVVLVSPSGEIIKAANAANPQAVEEIPF